MKIETRAIEALIPYINNARTHSDAQVAQIAASIREFGWTNPVLVDGENGIIAGHGRLMAARKLGMDEVPVIELAHMTPAQKRAYILADNKLALNSGWDDGLLKLELGELQTEGFDLELIGFDADELNDIMAAAEESEWLTDEDAVPEAQGDPVTKSGYIWLLGNHRLMCGDSTGIDAVDALLGGETWDVCVFDPPYELEGLYTEAMPIAEPGKKLLVMWDFKRFATAPSAALSAGWQPQYEFIWDCVQSWYTPNRPLQRHKAIGVFGDDPKFNTELAIIRDGKDRGPKRTVRNTRGSSDYQPLDGAKHIATVEAFPNTAQSDEHGHGKPVAWLEAIFNGVGGNAYLDLFGGSGSTVIACEKTKKTAFVMELDPRYCDQIIARWQEFTGKHATLEATGETFAELYAVRG